MNCIKKWGLSLILLSISVVVFASEPKQVSAIILDSPLDFDHEVLLPLIDSNLLGNTSVVDDNGATKTWLEYNRDKNADFEKSFNVEKYNEQLEFLSSIRKIDSDKVSELEKERLKKIVNKGMVKIITSSKYLEEVGNIASYMHGTHVAGIMINALSNVQLISFPMVSCSTRAGVKKFVKTFDAEKIRSEVRERFENISKVMKENNVRVANLSFGSSYTLALSHFLKVHPWYTRLFLNGRIEKVAWEYSKINFEEQERFYSQNPNTVFVLAAGNDGNNLEFEKNHTARVELSNVIKVANISAVEKLSGSSNRSNRYVQIGAIGEAVESLRAGGGESLFMSGTSQAAPKIAKKLIEIFQEKSGLTVNEAISILYHVFSKSKEELTWNIKGGLILVENSRLCSRSFLH